MIVIVTAMDKEYDLISEWIVKNWLDYKNVQNIALIKSGIGKVNAASCLTEFLSSNTSSKVTRVISVGCAGAAIAGLKPGNVVIGNSYCYHDVYCGEPNANGQVQGMPAVFPSDFSWIDMDERFRLGTIATGDKFVTTREQVLAIKDFLPNSYNVCAIDMESAALAQVCYKKGIGFTSIRVISDNPLEPNQTEQYVGFWDSLAEKAFSVVCKLLEIPSFKVDHTKLKPGLYVSRVDKWGLETATTFDIRVCQPNKDMMSPAVAHTVEHMMADYLRNDSPFSNSVLYFGPMGCLTGFYLILKGTWTSKLIKEMIVEAFKTCSLSKTIPGASEVECGNYKLNDLNGAKELCNMFSVYLSTAGPDKLNYPD